MRALMIMTSVRLSGAQHYQQACRRRKFDETARNKAATSWQSAAALAP
jgi:hypothetical protein